MNKQNITFREWLENHCTETNSYKDYEIMHGFEKEYLHSKYIEFTKE